MKDFGFTKREKEVLYLVAKGYYNEEIAQELGITTLTARNHVLNAMHKAEAKNRTDLSFKVFTER